MDYTLGKWLKEIYEEITTLDPFPIPQSQAIMSLPYVGDFFFREIEPEHPKFKDSGNSSGQLLG